MKRLTLKQIKNTLIKLHQEDLYIIVYKLHKNIPLIRQEVNSFNRKAYSLRHKA